MVMAAGPALIGREREHATVAAFLERGARGPAALVLAGPAGIGKSSIWRQALVDAAGRGFHVLETRAVEAEAQLAFGGLADILNDPFDGVAEALPPAQRLALEHALQRVPAGDRPPPPLAVSLGTLGAVRTLAEQAPVLLAVDDLPWLDSASARVLDYLVRRVSDLPIAYLPSIRTGPNATPAAAGLDFGGPMERLEVGPLDINAIGQLLHRELSTPLRRPALAWIHRESGGNPFVALELGRAVERAGGHAGLELPALPTETDELIRGRLEALPPESRLALAAAAALSQPSRELVSAAVEGAAPGLDAAIAGGVLEDGGGRLRFAHPLLAATAYRRLDEDERRALHARLADAVSDLEQRARHLAIAARGADEAVAAELELAAEHARTRGATDAAAELAEQASRLTPPEDEAGVQRRVIAAGWQFIHAGDPGRARTLLEEHVGGLQPGQRRAEALQVLADVRSSDDWEARLVLLDRALAEAGDDHALRSQLLGAKSQTFFHLARDARAFLEAAMQGVAEADLTGDPSVICSALLTAALAQGACGVPLDPAMMERARALAPEVERLGETRWKPGFALGLLDASHDRREEAAATFAELHARAIAEGDWDSLSLITINEAFLAIWQGRWVDAASFVEEGEAGARQNGQPAALAYALTARALLQLSLGQEAEARVAAEEGIAAAERITAPTFTIDLHGVLGARALALGDVRAAEVELRAATEPWMREGYLGTLGWLGERAEALVALDRLDEAIALLDAYEESTRQANTPSVTAGMLRARGLAAAARGDEEGAEAAFAEALELHDRVGEPYEKARTLLAEGESLRRFRQRGRAREALQAAVELFAALPAPIWLARAEAELARTGHREAGAQLTATEQQVAELVAAGRTNKEVAEQLFMSPHTVEAHLTRIYQSLGVRRRTELARALAARPEDGEAAE